MNEKIDQLTDLLVGYAATYGLNVLGAIATLIAGYLVAGWLSRATNHGFSKIPALDPALRSLPGKVVRLAVLVFTMIAVLNRFGVQGGGSRPAPWSGAGLSLS